MDVAHDFVILARQLASNNNFKISFNMYMCAFLKDLRVRTQYEAEFRTVLAKLNEGLALADNKSEVFSNFETAMKVFPGNVDILSLIGTYLYRYGFFEEALCHFEKVLLIDNSLATAEKNFNKAKRFLFPRNQFRILNDRIRNYAYRAAIRSSITISDSVLDIDTATGILALYANERTPIAITACESSITMAKLAECVMLDNLAHEVFIINKPSVTSNRADIYGRRSVLLTDMIDSGLFGENILQSLLHAYEKLLLKNAKIIPGRAEYFIVGVKCDGLTKKYRLGQNIKDILKVSQRNVHTTTYYDETYHSDDVHLYEDVKYMCEPQSLLTIDFNDYQDIHDKLYAQEPFTVDLTATENGEINMLIGWFNLYLNDNIMITTDPTSERKATAWQQAIFFDVIPKKVRRNESVNIPFLTYGGRLTTLPDLNAAIIRISPETLTYLNDTDYMNMIVKSIGTVCVHVGQTVNIEEVDIADLSPFPLFGVLMLRRGANSLICHVKTADDERFLHTVLVANGIPASKVTILVSDNWCYKMFKGKKFHVIFSNILDYNGDVDIRRKGFIQKLKRLHLLPGGICLPSSITVMGQLISSNYLEINNRVEDDNVGYRMAKHVHPYQVSLATYLDIGRLEYEPLSEVFEVALYDDNLRSDLVEVSILNDGECNAILCWYKVQLMEHWEEIYTNRSNSFVCGLAYMPMYTTNVFKDDIADVLRCVDGDGSFKLVLATEPY